MQKLSFKKTKAFFAILIIFNISKYYIAVDPPNGLNPEISSDNKTATFYMANGTCTENITTTLPCHSWIVLRGTSLYSKGVLAFFYALFLIYLFLGIAIVADIFMGAIEIITRYIIKKSVKK